MHMLTCGSAIDEVIVIPADLAGLIIADNILMGQAQMRLAGPWIAEAPCAQQDAAQPCQLLHLPAT